MRKSYSTHSVEDMKVSSKVDVPLFILPRRANDLQIAFATGGRIRSGSLRIEGDHYRVVLGHGGIAGQMQIRATLIAG